MPAYLLEIFLFWHNYIFTRNGKDMYMKVPCTLHLPSPMLSSVVQCQNQKIDIGTASAEFIQTLLAVYATIYGECVSGCVLQCNSSQMQLPAVTTRNIVQNFLSPQGSHVLLHLQPQSLIFGNH